MDEPRKALPGEDAARLEKTAMVLPPAEKGQHISTYISRLQATGPGTGDKGVSTLQELAFSKGLNKVLGFYGTMIQREMPDGNKNLVYHGNVVVNKDHHGIELSTKMVEVPTTFADSALFEVDLDDILADFKEFALMMDDFFDFLRINVPSIVFLHNAEAFLARSFKVKDSSAASAFIVRLTKFITERDFQRDRLVLVIVTDNPRAMDRRFLNAVDFTVEINLPNRQERELYIKHLLSPEGAVDFSLVASEMDGWSWSDIESFAKHAMLQKQARDLKELSAKFLVDAIHGDNDLDRFTLPSALLVPASSSQKVDVSAQSSRVTPSTPDPGAIQSCQTAGMAHVVSDPFNELLWESAADRDYDAVARVLEHLEKGLFLQEDRAYLARYPFLLHDDVLTAKRKLDAAKNKIDMIKKHFRGKSA